jgi:hypothetical protein
MQRLLVCCVFLLLANSAEAKDRGPPPAGGEALYKWCWNSVILGHGWPAPQPGYPHRVAMRADDAVRMADACMQSHGKIH